MEKEKFKVILIYPETCIHSFTYNRVMMKNINYVDFERRRNFITI